MRAGLMTASMLRRTGGPEVLEVGAVACPQPQVRQVLIRNHVVGVNNIDTIIRRGELPVGAMPSLPHVLGVEGAGTIEALGEGVDNFTIGQRVLWFGTPGVGGYSQFVALDVRYVAAIGDHVKFEQAAASPVAYATARHMLFDYGRPSPGAWLLIRSAAGGVGSALIQLARNAGLNAIAVADGSKLEFAREQGAVAGIDYKREDVAARVHDITGGEGIALSLNPVAGNTILEDLALLAPFGQVVSYGYLGGPPAGSATDLLRPFFSKSVGIRVSDIYTYYTADPAGMARTLAGVAADLASGRINPYVFRTLSMDQAGDAHRILETGQARGKLVLSINHDS